MGKVKQFAPAKEERDELAALEAEIAKAKVEFLDATKAAMEEHDNLVLVGIVDGQVVLIQPFTGGRLEVIGALTEAATLFAFSTRGEGE